MSTLSFTINKHYCKGNLIEVSLMGKVNGCAKANKHDGCDDSSQNIEDNCCSDTLEIIKSSNNNLKHNNDITLETLHFSAVFFTTYINLFKELPRNVIPFKDYIPPLLINDLTVLHDTFLI